MSAATIANPGLNDLPGSSVSSDSSSALSLTSSSSSGLSSTGLQGFGTASSFAVQSGALSFTDDLVMHEHISDSFTQLSAGLPSLRMETSHSAVSQQTLDALASSKLGGLATPAQMSTMLQSAQTRLSSATENPKFSQMVHKLASLSWDTAGPVQPSWVEGFTAAHLIRDTLPRNAPNVCARIYTCTYTHTHAHALFCTYTHTHAHALLYSHTHRPKIYEMQ